MKYQPTSVTQQLSEYIKKNLKKGYTLDSLRFSLLNQGYSKISIENAIDVVNKQIAEEIPPIEERPEITYKVIADTHEDLEYVKVSLETKKGFFKRLFG